MTLISTTEATRITRIKDTTIGSASLLRDVYQVQPIKN